MTWTAWLATGAILVLAVWGVATLRRHASTTPGGRRFFAHPQARWGLGVLAFFVAVAVAAPLVTAYDPNRQLGIVTLQNLPPSWLHPLGTDVFSRDVWSRLVYGGRVSLAVSALAMLVAITAGTAVGAIAGYYRRWIDAVLMRLVDLGLAVPRIFLLLAAMALWERVPIGALVLLIGATSWFSTSRLVRAEVMSLRTRPFVDAARSLGAGAPRVIFRHLLPSAAAPIIVAATLGIGNVMLLEAGLSFLGIGVHPPVASWGNMIADAQDQIATTPWASLFPGLAIASVVMAFTAVGDALRDALDPRQRRA